MIERRTITDRDEWLLWRRQDVTASDVASVFGLNPFQTPLKLWAKKTGRAPEPYESPLMRRGRWLEPAVLQALAETLRLPVIKEQAYYRDPAIRLGATPDAFAGPVLVECKVVSRPVFEAWPEDDPPIYYTLQALTGAMLTEAPAALLACLVIDTFSADLVTFDIERNEKAEARIREGVAEFWAHVAAGVIPDPDYDSDGELLAQLYRPREEIAAIDLSGDNRLPEILIERLSLKGQIKARSERVEAINAEIIAKLKGAPKAICGEWRISHKVQYRKETIIKATSYPVLTIRERKDKAA